jgi:hypothetical protein
MRRDKIEGLLFGLLAVCAQLQVAAFVRTASTNAEQLTPARQPIVVGRYQTLPAS